MAIFEFKSEKIKNLYILDRNESGIEKIANKLKKDIYDTSDCKINIYKNHQIEKDNMAIVIGTYGNGFSDEILKDISEIKAIENKRESFFIAVREDFFNIKNALVICGSEKIGTIYGMFFLSKLLGVTPVRYFGDASPFKYKKIILENFKKEEEKLKNTELFESGVYVKKDDGKTVKNIYLNTYISDEPSIRYRGFFINDEWPCFGNWTMEHFGGFNASMYDHIFEYLLRMNGNYLWPAMWNSAFMEEGPGLLSMELANEYGIYIGMSHHEHCNRSGIEYGRLRGKDSIYGDAWDFRNNREGILKFWEDGLIRSKGLNTIPTVGMRGENDSKLLKEGENISSNVDVLKDIIKCQNKLIDGILGKVPKVFAVYKEVEDYFFGETNNGLKGYAELDDTILILCDDNHSNMRALPYESFRNHRGGFGMYYHLDYHGDPISYEWVCSTPISKVWEQMSEAYEYGVRDLWIVNVGDVKFQEYPLSFFMNLAYDYPKYSKFKMLRKYENDWIRNIFGDFLDNKILQKVCEVLHEFLELNHLRRPEALNSNIYSAYENMEADRILKRVNELESLNDRILDEAKANGCEKAYISLLHFQVLASANLIKMQLYAAKNRHYAKTGRAIANVFAKYIKACIKKDEILSEKFGEFNNGKWNGMQLASHIGFTNWNDEDFRYPVINTLYLPKKPRLVVSRADSEMIFTNQYFPKDLEIDFSNNFKKKAVLEIANGGSGKLVWSSDLNSDFVRLSKESGEVELLDRIYIEIDTSVLETEEIHECRFKIFTENEFVPIVVRANRKELCDVKSGAFLFENNECVILAKHYSGKGNSLEDSGGFEIIEDFGKYSSGIKVFPLKNNYTSYEAAPYVEYEFFSECDREVTINLHTSPANPLVYGGELSFFIGVNDDEIIRLVIADKNYKGGDNSCSSWARAVLDGEHIGSIKYNIKAGNNSLKVFAAESGLVLEKIVIRDMSCDKDNSYLGQAESFRNI